MALELIKSERAIQALKRGAKRLNDGGGLYLQSQGGDAMDDAIAIIEAAAAAASKPASHVAAPGDAAKPVSTGQSNVPAPALKTTKVIRAADLSVKSYLETETDVDAYVYKLKAELLAAIRADYIARIQ